MCFGDSRLVGSGSLPRRCRVSQVRLIDVVQSATDIWCNIFSRDPINVNFGRGTCSEIMKKVKGFLSEPPLPVPEEEAMAFRSIKKLLPDSCRCLEAGMLDSLGEKLSQPAVKLPAGYLRFVTQQAERFFSKGWDSTYHRHCLTTTPPIKACEESPRSFGGSLRLTSRQRTDQVTFLDRVLGHDDDPYEGMEVHACANLVQSAGKPRPLTQFSAELLTLRPLHKALYDRMSRSPWLCRGDVTKEKLASAGFRAGAGFLTSGDYASATDGLPIEVAEAVLRAAQRTSLSVPDGVWSLAFDALRPILYKLKDSPDARFKDLREWEVEVSRGQMMGSFLSFPLLCFQNYLAFKWAIFSTGRKGRFPLLINGDDILFQSDESFSSDWMNVVVSVGLEVERSKTSFSDEFGSLNSTLLRWRGGVLDVVPTLRFGMLKKTDFPQGLGRSFRSFAGSIECPEVKWRASRAFFRAHLATLRNTRLTLDELGFRGSLARRLGRIFNLLPTDNIIHEAPPCPSSHDVKLNPELVVRVDRGALSDELREVNSYMMSSWKWTHKITLASSAIQYALKMSSIRRPAFGPSFSFLKTSNFGGGLTTPITGRDVRRRFVRQSDPPTELIFVDLLASQEYTSEPLPDYSEVEWVDHVSDFKHKDGAR